MPSLKSLKLRIKSIKSTQKITKAMKMVAASKLKRARDAAAAAHPYADRLEKIMSSLALDAQNSATRAPLLNGTGNDKIHLVVVSTSDRGLCGAFNSSIIRAAKAKVERLESEGKIVKLVCIGKKAHDLLKGAHEKKIVATFEGLTRKGVHFSAAQEVAEKVLELFGQNQFDVCHIVFNHFKSVISQIVTEQQLIPLTFVKDEITPLNDMQPSLYEFEPSEEQILNELLPKNIAVQIFRALLENNASEQGARMTAMDNATRNSGEMIKKLTLVYNRTRQAHITRELIEIISGAEAL